jgi:hypothetical protein
MFCLPPLHSIPVTMPVDTDISHIHGSTIRESIRMRSG